MKPSYARHRSDGNKAGIRDALLAVGASVYESDWVDLVVGYRRRTYLIEVKTKTGKLNPSQQELFDTWRGHYSICRSPDDALRVIGATK